MADKEPRQAMWLKYVVELRMTGRFAAALPRTAEEIQKMLENRMPTKPPANYTPVAVLAKQVAEEVGVGAEAEAATEEGTEEVKFGWATFKRDGDGLYYEGRCVRGHIKDCATQVKDWLTPEVKALKAKVANKVYVMTDIIPLLDSSGHRVTELAGTEQRFVQVMTRQGPRSTIKYVDYVEAPVLSFELKVLNDGVIGEDILRAIFDYGSIHGLGQERSQGWGRYLFTLNGK